MNLISRLIPTSTFAIVMLGCFGFAAIFLFQQKPPKTEEQKCDRASIIGIVLQGIACALIKFGRSYDEYAAKVPAFLPLNTLTGR